MKRVIFLFTLVLSIIFLTNIVTAITLNDRYGLNVNFLRPTSWTNNIADIYLGSGAKWIKGSVPIVQHKKMMMFITSAEWFDIHKQNYTDILNGGITNIVNYNYFFQGFSVWGGYCKGINEAKIKEITQFWRAKGFITGPYIDVAEANKSVVNDPSNNVGDSIANCTEYENGPWPTGCRMNINPNKGWYKYLKDCALKLINITTDNGVYKTTGLSIDRSDILGSPGLGGGYSPNGNIENCYNSIDDDGDNLADDKDADCQDMWLRQWLDDVKNNASRMWGVNVKFVGNSFHNWQTETVKKFMFIGSDGVYSEDDEIDNLKNWINSYSNLAQYTEKHIFYIDPHLQENCTATTVCPPEHFRHEFQNILNYTYFTFFDDVVLYLYPVISGTYSIIDQNLYYDYSNFIPNLTIAKSKGFNTTIVLLYPNVSLNNFTNLVEYEDYVNATVRQLKGLVDAYEIWSEPYNNKNGWFQGEPEKYFLILNKSYKLIKSIDPNALVIGTPTVVSYNYDERSFWQSANAESNRLEGKNITRYMDAVSLHLYDKPEWTPEEPAWSDTAINDIKNRINQIKTLFLQWKGSGIPLWITETGSSDWQGDQNITMNKVFRVLNEVANKTFWYESIDDATQSTRPEGHYGLLTASITPKPSFNNFQIWTIDGYCSTLNKTIYDAFYSGNTDCNSANWNPVADVNKDRSVSIFDLTIFYNNRYDEAWCNKTLGNTTDACYACQDTDGGQNFYTRGTISGFYIGASYSYQDRCWDRFNLIEYYCNGQNNASIIQRCKTGTEDSDGGTNSEVVGTCTVYDGCKNDGMTNYGICNKSSYTDYCSSSSTLIEYYVSGSTCISTPITCGSDYVCSAGKCKISSTRCPILNAWDGNEFKEIELLNIHALEDEDITFTSKFTMQPKDGKYEILLHEAAYKFWDGSHIDSIKLVESNEKECQLISAVHSKQGDVLQNLLYSDNVRVRTFPEEEIKLVYDGCYGNDFTFTIEGYNRKCGPYECGYFVFGYPLILIAPIISFVFVLLMVALYLLILSLLEKYKII